MSETNEAAVAERKPLSLADVLADLQGFGIEESEEILTISSGKDSLRIKFSNISTDDDLQANLATEETKGYQHFQEIKAEILSRAISWVNGIDLTKLEGKACLVYDAKAGVQRHFRAQLRETIKSWGSEVMQVLWKALMVHVQKIEDRLFESLPEAAVMTEVERRYRERTEKELEDITRDVLQPRINELFDQEINAPDEPEAAVS